MSSSSGSGTAAKTGTRTPLKVYRVPSSELRKAERAIDKQTKGRLLSADASQRSAKVKKTSSGTQSGASSATSGKLTLIALYTYDTHNRRLGRKVFSTGLDQRYSYHGWRVQLADRAERGGPGASVRLGAVRRCALVTSSTASARPGAFFEGEIECRSIPHGTPARESLRLECAVIGSVSRVGSATLV